MSLFDVIKYSNIDLGDHEELARLPKQLFKLYYNKVYPSTDVITEPTPYFNLTFWYRVNPKYMRIAFTKALKEYDNESI